MALESVKPSPKPAGSRITAALVPQGALAGQPDVPLDRPVTTVGSGEQNRLQLSSRTVSRSHALFVKAGQTVYVIDLASRTGVQVNGQPVRDHDLANGDRIQLGKFIFRYRTPLVVSPAANPQPATPAVVIRVGHPPIRVKTRAVLIGRRDTCDVILSEESGASNVHAVLFQVDHNWVLLDLESRAGTAVNGNTIVQQVVKFGDRLTIGSETILFQPAADVAELAEQPAAPAEELPAEPLPVEQAPVEQAPVEQAPVEEAPLEEASVQEAPAVEAQAEPIPPDDAIPLQEPAPPEPSPAEPATVDPLPIEALASIEEPIAEPAWESGDSVPEQLPVEVDSVPVETAPWPVEDTAIPIESAGESEPELEPVTAEILDPAAASTADIPAELAGVDPTTGEAVAEIPADLTDTTFGRLVHELTAGHGDLVEEPAAAAEAPAAGPVADDWASDLEFADETETVPTHVQPADHGQTDADSHAEPAPVEEPVPHVAADIVPEPGPAEVLEASAAVAPIPTEPPRPPAPVAPVDPLPLAKAAASPAASAAPVVPAAATFDDLEDFVFVPEEAAAAATDAPEALFFGDEDPEEILAAVPAPPAAPRTDDPSKSPSPPAWPTGGVTEQQAEPDSSIVDDLPATSASAGIEAPATMESPDAIEPETVTGPEELPSSLLASDQPGLDRAEPPLADSPVEPIAISDESPHRETAPIMLVVEPQPAVDPADPVALVPDFSDAVARVDDLAPSVDAPREGKPESVDLTEVPAPAGDTVPFDSAAHSEPADSNLDPVGVTEPAADHPAVRVEEMSDADVSAHEVADGDITGIELPPISPEYEEAALAQVQRLISDHPAPDVLDSSGPHETAPLLSPGEDLPEAEMPEASTTPEAPGDDPGFVDRSAARDEIDALPTSSDVSGLSPAASLAAAMAEAAGLLGGPISVGAGGAPFEMAGAGAVVSAAIAAAGELAPSEEHDPGLQPGPFDTVAKPDHGDHQPTPDGATEIAATEPPLGDSSIDAASLEPAPVEMADDLLALQPTAVDAPAAEAEPAGPQIDASVETDPDGFSAPDATALPDPFGETQNHPMPETPVEVHHGPADLEWLAEDGSAEDHSAEDHHEPPAGIIVEAHDSETDTPTVAADWGVAGTTAIGGIGPVDSSLTGEITLSAEAVEGELLPDEPIVGVLTEAADLDDTSDTGQTIDAGPTDWSATGVAGEPMVAIDQLMTDVGTAPVDQFDGVEDDSLTEPAAASTAFGSAGSRPVDVGSGATERQDEPSFDLSEDPAIFAGEDDLEFFEAVDPTPEIGVETATEVWTELATPSDPPELAEPTQTPTAGDVTATIATDLPTAVELPHEPASEPPPTASTPPAKAGPRGPSLFGFQFDGGSFLGGMPLPLPPAAPGAVAAAAGLAGAVAPAVGAAISLGFDPKATPPAGLAAIAATPAPATAPSPAAKRPKTPPRPVRIPVETAMTALTGAPANFDPLSGGVGQARRATTTRFNTPGQRPRVADVFSQVETPIGVDVFGGPAATSEAVVIPPINGKAPPALAEPPVAEEVFPVAPVRRGVAAKVSVLLLLMVALPAGIWWTVNRFVPTSATVVGTLTFDGLARKTKAEQDSFVYGQKRLLEGDDVRLAAEAILASQNKPAGFISDPAKYAEIIDGPTAISSNDDTFQLSVTVPQDRPGVDQVDALLSALKAKDGDLNVAKETARKAAEDAHAAVVDATREIERIKSERIALSNAAQEAPRRGAVEDQELAAANAERRLEQARAVRLADQEVLDEVRKQDPSKPGDPDSDAEVIALRKDIKHLQEQLDARPKKPAAAPGDAVLANAGDNPFDDQIRAQLEPKKTRLQARLDELKADADRTPEERDRLRQKLLEKMNIDLGLLQEAERRDKELADTETAKASRMRAEFEQAQKTDLEVESKMRQQQSEEEKLHQLVAAEKEKLAAAQAAVAIPADGRVVVTVDPASISNPRMGITGVLGGITVLLLSSMIVGELRRPRVMAPVIRAAAVPAYRQRTVPWPQPQQIRALDQPAAVDAPTSDSAGGF